MARFRTFGRRSEERAGNWLAFQDIILRDTTNAGVSVTQEKAPNLPAVFRCWSLNADTVSTLPVDCMVRRGDKRMPYTEPFWLSSPNDVQDWGQFVAQVQVSLEADGNAFILKTVDSSGRLVALYLLSPMAVTVELEANGFPRYVVDLKTGREVYHFNEILHIRGMTLPGELRGLSPIAAAKETIGTGLAAEQYGANFFGTGATLSGVITVPGELKEAASDRLKASFARKHGGVSKSHAVGVLSGGATWTPLSVNPEESQFLQTRRFTDTQIANLYGVPPEYVTDAEGAKGYVTGLYARQYMWLQTGINPRLTRLERAFSSLLPKGVYIKFNRNAFLQMDPKERAEFYAAGLQGRWLVPDEVREKEDMDPLPGGSEPLDSVQWRGSIADKVEAVGSLVRSGFDPAAALKMLDLPAMPYLDVQPVTVRPVAEDGTQLAPAKTDATE